MATESELEKLASRVFTLAKRTAPFMNEAQATSRNLRNAMEALAEAKSGSIRALEGTPKTMQELMSGVGEFGQHARDFADQLVGPHSGSSAVLTGNYGALKTEPSSKSEASVLRVDPETGNELTWILDLDGRTIRAVGKLQNLTAEEGRTSKEIRTAMNVGRTTRQPSYPGPKRKDRKVDLGPDHGGHLIAYSIAGSNGIVNIVPQNFQLNQGAYSSMEDVIRKYLAKPDHKEVLMTVDLLWDEEVRPSKFVVEITAGGQDDDPSLQLDHEYWFLNERSNNEPQ